MTSTGLPVAPSPRHPVFFALLLLASAAFALDVPPAPTQWVTDRAGVLGSSDVAALNEKLRAFEGRSGAQFIIYIFPSLESESLEDFTMRAAERWKVGQKKYDNGLILFVFIKERRTRIEVGYGLEGTVTDARSAQSLRLLASYFQKGDYAGGLNAVVDRLTAEIEGKEPPVPANQPRAPAVPGGWSFADILFLIFIIMFILMFIAPLSRRGGCGGCFFPFFFPGGGGITYGGGGWGGGGGGGFGGFSGGGGSFGGGGASGSW